MTKNTIDVRDDGVKFAADNNEKLLTLLFDIYYIYFLIIYLLDHIIS